MNILKPFFDHQGRLLSVAKHEFRSDAAHCRAKEMKKYECHRCGEYHSHLVEMVEPYDPESRGEYCSNCIIEKRKDGWRVV